MSVSPVASSPASLVQSILGNRITELVKRIFLELTISFALATLISTFTIEANVAILFSALVVQSIACLVFHTIAVFGFPKIGNFLAAANWACFSGYNAQTLVHEAGHACAIFSLYTKSNPKILINPFQGGVTQYRKSPLTALGKWLGPSAATCAIVSAGPALSLLVSSVLLTIGYSMRKQHPQLSQYFLVLGLADFIQHAHYAYTAIGTRKDLSHDFSHLAIFGLNPKVATIGIAAMAAAILFGNWLRSRNES